MEIDLKLLSDYSLSNDLFKLIKVLAVRTGNKVDYTKISSVTGQLLRIFKIIAFIRFRSIQIRVQTGRRLLTWSWFYF